MKTYDCVIIGSGQAGTPLARKLAEAGKKHKDEIVHQWRNGGKASLEKVPNLDLFFGDATFTDNKIISVKPIDGGEPQEFKAEQIFINTGGKTILPNDIKGLSDVEYLTSTTILDLEDIPEHLLIIGGNYIGLEFGQMFRRFGSTVTILERSPRFNT